MDAWFYLFFGEVLAFEGVLQSKKSLPVFINSNPVLVSENDDVIELAPCQAASLLAVHSMLSFQHSFWS